MTLARFATPNSEFTPVLTANVFYAVGRTIFYFKMKGLASVSPLAPTLALGNRSDFPPCQDIAARQHLTLVLDIAELFTAAASA